MKVKTPVDLLVQVKDYLAMIDENEAQRLCGKVEYLLEDAGVDLDTGDLDEDSDASFGSSESSDEEPEVEQLDDEEDEPVEEEPEEESGS